VGHGELGAVVDDRAVLEREPSLPRHLGLAFGRRPAQADPHAVHIAPAVVEQVEARPLSIAGEAADDDASGCAVVLELARVLGMPDVRTNRSVRFVFWNNEEFGMDGSGTYALERAPLQATPNRSGSASSSMT